MGGEIELYSRINNPIEAIDKIGDWFNESGAFGCSKPVHGKMIALTCMTERISPVQFMHKYHLLSDGKLQLKSHHMLGEFRKLGGKHKWLKDGQDGQAAKLQLTMDGNTVEYEFTIDMAKAQGLVRDKSAWVKNPGNMLRARCISNAVPMLCPEIIGGADLEEQDTPAATVTASPPPLFPATKTSTVQVETKQAPKFEIVQDAEVISPNREPEPTGTPAESVANASKPADIQEIKSHPLVTGKTDTEAAQPSKVEVGPDGRITPGTLQIFVQMCQARGKEFEDRVMTWLVNKSKIKNNNPQTIAPAFLQDVFSQWGKFVEVVEAVK